jgi:hypothetical protein
MTSSAMAKPMTKVQALREAHRRWYLPPNAHGQVAKRRVEVILRRKAVEKRCEVLIYGDLPAWLSVQAVGRGATWEAAIADAEKYLPSTKEGS